MLRRQGQREGSPFTGVGPVFVKELSDHLSSTRMLVLTLFVIVFGALPVGFTLQTLREVTQSDQYLFLRIFTVSPQQAPISFVAELTFMIPLMAIGLGFEVLVQVTMDREDASTIAEFERALAAIAEVRHAERLFGDPDYLIRVATASLAAYQALRDEKLGALPGVQRLTSTIVMKRVVEDRPYPT